MTGTISPSEQSRRSHSILSAIGHGITVWYAFFGGIAAWAIHLLALSSLTRYTCTVPSTLWTLHAITAGCIALCLLSMAFAGVLARTGPTARFPGATDDSPDLPGGSREDRIARFYGQLAFLSGAFNLLLIVVEELAVVSLKGVRCG